MSISVDVILIVFALLGAATFVVSFPIVADVRHWTREGWHMWLFTVALCVLALTSVARRAWPEITDTLAYELIVQADYLALGLLLWQRSGLLFLARRDARRDAERECARCMELHQPHTEEPA